MKTAYFWRPAKLCAAGNTMKCLLVRHRAKEDGVLSSRNTDHMSSGRHTICEDQIIIHTYTLKYVFHLYFAKLPLDTA